MLRAAAASSPHMISLMTRPSFPFSSDRRIGRPTMEGNWNSGKFWRSGMLVGGIAVRLEARQTESLLLLRIQPSGNRFLRQGLCD